MALITAGRQPQVESFFTADKDVFREAITNQQPTDAPGNMRDAVLLALSLYAGQRHAGGRDQLVMGPMGRCSTWICSTARCATSRWRVEKKTSGSPAMALRKVLDDSGCLRHRSLL